MVNHPFFSKIAIEPGTDNRTSALMVKLKMKISNIGFDLLWKDDKSLENLLGSEDKQNNRIGHLFRT